MMLTQTPGLRLRTKLELAAPGFAAATERLWTSPQVREIYPIYLATMHMIARSAVPLLDVARERATIRAKHDPVAAGLIEYLESRLRERAGQDDWLLEDLAAAGADPTIPIQAIPSPKVASLVGAQYYWIYHHHPVALLGHIGAIATYPPPPGFAARLQGRTGLPEAAFRTITWHERNDPSRRAEFYALLERLPLTRRHEALIGLSALHSMDASVEVFDEIAERVTLKVA